MTEPSKETEIVLNSIFDGACFGYSSAQWKFALPIIQQALGETARKAREAALEEAADYVWRKQYPNYGDAKRIADTIRELKSKPREGK